MEGVLRTGAPYVAFGHITNTSYLEILQYGVLRYCNMVFCFELDLYSCIFVLCFECFSPRHSLS